MKTFNRGKLRKLVGAGKVTMIGSYHYDDMSGGERSEKRLPVAVAPADRNLRQNGTLYLSEHDFTSKSGHCYVSGPATVSLIVHSNCNYEFEIPASEIPADAPPPPPTDAGLFARCEALASASHELHRRGFALAYPSLAPTYDGEHYAVTVKDKRKYINIDKGTSGWLMVEKATGDVYGISGYGVPNKGRRYGNIDNLAAEQLPRSY